MSVICSIGTAVPEYKHQQADVHDFMSETISADRVEKIQLKALYQRSGIDTRYSVLPDFSVAPAARNFYTNADGKNFSPNLDERMQNYYRHALPVSVQAVENSLKEGLTAKEVTHLITVSCTGFSAPGLDIELQKALALRPNVYRTSVNFMGCYAALHAMKQADMICRADENAQVLVVCTELCTLHFQNVLNKDNLVANSLFADGSAAFWVLGEQRAKEKKLQGLKVLDFYSEVDHEGEEHMAWHISKDGFLMTLSSYIPMLVQKGIKKIVKKALQQMKLEEEKVQHWAIHPGGRKILDVASKELGLDEGQLKTSYEVLNHYGNMSSPTIIFILKALWEQEVKKENESIFAAAFGPGLVTETVALSSVNYAS